MRRSTRTARVTRTTAGDRRRGRRLRGVTYCERCGQACDAACRGRAARARDLDLALLQGLRR